MVWQTLQRYFNEIILEWSVMQRMLLALLLSFCEYLLYASWLWFVESNTWTHQYVNIDVISAHSPYVFWLLLSSFFFAALVAMAWKMGNRYFFIAQSLWMVKYSLVLGYLAYLIGHSNLVTGITIGATPVFGLMLIERRAVYLSIVLNVLILFGVLTLVNMDVLKHPPLYAEGVTPNNYFWVWSFLYFCLLKLLVMLTIVDVVLLSLKYNSARMRVLLEHDALTGLRTRHSLYDQMREFLARQQQASVILVDLDHFKSINDTYGHLVGDKVLKVVSQRLVDSVRSVDVVSRFGGEEFLVFLPDCPAGDAQAIAERIRVGLHEVQLTAGNGEPISVRASLGVACSLDVKQLDQIGVRITQDVLNPLIQMLVDRADRALYYAKKTGRDRVIFANEKVLNA